MRCEEAENHIADYLAGTLAPESPLLEHLSVCPRCRASVQELQSTWADLGRLPVPPTSPVMGPALQTAVAEIKLPIWRRPMPYLLKPALVIVMSVVTALFLGHSLVERTSHEPTVRTELRALNDNDGHFRGSANAPVTLVEYGDYACPACATYNAVVNDVLKEYPDRLRLEYRHFPLMPIHPNAMAAALAAEAAGEQGRYWEMHDLLFTSQQRWAHASNPEEEFKALAAAIGLDASRFARDLQSVELRRRVTNDESNAREALVSATPTFFINGKTVSPLPSLDSFRALIDSLPKK
jgi:protein-disulfide isomerase